MAAFAYLLAAAPGPAFSSGPEHSKRPGGGKTALDAGRRQTGDAVGMGAHQTRRVHQPARTLAIRVSDVRKMHPYARVPVVSYFLNLDGEDLGSLHGTVAVQRKVGNSLRKKGRNSNLRRRAIVGLGGGCPMDLTDKKFLWARNSVLALFVLAGMLGLTRVLLTQDVVWVSNGLGWDGVHYDRLVTFFRTGDFVGPPASFPFCARVGTPVILSLLPTEVGFFELNIVFALLFAGTILLLVRAYTGNNLPAISSALFVALFLQFAPIRFSSYYPAYMDPPFLFLAGASALFVSKRRFILAAAMLLCAIPFREAALYAIPFIAIVAIATCTRKALVVMQFLAVFAVALSIRSALPGLTGCETKPQLSTALINLHTLLTDPQRLMVVIAGCSMTIGPLLVLVKTNDLLSIATSKSYAHAFFALFYFAALASVGGSDVTRIFYSFVPFFAPILFYAFANASLSGLTLGLTGWLLTNQILNDYAQPAADWPDNDLVGRWAQFPDHGHPVIAVNIILIWIILFLLRKPLGRAEGLVFPCKKIGAVEPANGT